MRARSGAWSFVAGAAGAFSLVVGIGLLTNGDSATPLAAETTSTTTAEEWVSGREVRIGPSVVVPLSLETPETGRVTFTYEVAALLPQRGELVIDSIPAAPTSFTLVTRDGREFGATVRGPGARAITFDVPEDVTAGNASSVRIDRFMVGSPVMLPIDLPLEGAAWHPAGPGVRVRLVRVLEQAQNDLIVVELESPGDAATHLTVDGIGRDWASASGSMLGSSNWTLDHRGESLPDPLPLVVRGVVFVPFDTDVSMNVIGLVR